MDKQRDSFLFFKEWWDILKAQGAATRYEVYDAIMMKVFDDQDRKVSPLGEMALSFILPVIERSFDKYDEVCEKRREAGKKGGMAKASKSKQMLAKPSKPSYNDNDNNNDNDNDNDVEEEKEDNVPFSSDSYVKELTSGMMGATAWKESVCMSFKKTMEQIDMNIGEFAIHVQTYDRTPTDLSDAKRWFVSWLRKREQYLNEQKPQPPKESDQEKQRIRESEERHQQYLRAKANAKPMPEELAKRLGL